MIKLVVTSKNLSTTTHSFDCSSIIIGSQPLPETHLIILDQGVESRHAQILKTNDGWVVLNLARDPFATFNDLPFGKQSIANNDSLQIGNTKIVFYLEEQRKPVSVEHLPLPTSEFLDKIDVQDLFLQVEALTHVKLPVAKSSMQNDRIVEPLEEDPIEIHSFNEDESPNTILTKMVHSSLKDDYLSEYDDVHETTVLHEINHPNAIGIDAVKNWHRLFKVFTVLVCLVFIVSGIVYLWISDQTEEEEISAAQSVADLAMALTYAQVKDMYVYNQNWSDFEFIKKNLSSMLSPDYSFLDDFDRYGHLINSSYTLRIYTDNNLSHFIVIAQPSPSLIHWVIPRPSIVVDSHSMEIRKIRDLKVINRLLVNSNSLDGANEAEISATIKQGALIPLHQLTSDIQKNNFSPPKMFGLLQPEASNFIYNAPRYYYLGQRLIEQAIQLIHLNSLNENDAELFLHELSKLNKFPDFLLYSAQGIQYAMEAQRALNILAPEDKFMFGYLQFDSEGDIANAHMLIDGSNSSELAMQDIPSGFFLEKSLHDTMSVQSLMNKKSLKTDSDVNRRKAEDSAGNVIVDTTDVIYLHLTGLLDYRHRSLKPIGDAIIQLIQKEINIPQEDFQQQIARLKDKFLEKNHEQQQEMYKHINRILVENEYLPAAQMVEFMKAAGLENVFNKYLESKKDELTAQDSLYEFIQIQLDLVDCSDDWKSLNEAMTQISKMLQFQNLPDVNKLINYQDLARSSLMQKLGQFLLSHDHALPKNAYSKADRELLVHILDISWIIDYDAYDFYLAEFDQHSH